MLANTKYRYRQIFAYLLLVEFGNSGILAEVASSGKYKVQKDFLLSALVEFGDSGILAEVASAGK